LVGIKDSAGDLAHCQELCRRFPGLQVFTGNDQLILSALEAGAAGCVTGLVNLFAPMAASICAAFARSAAEAGRLQDRFTGLWRVLERYQPYPSLLKALAARRYGDPGWRRVRPPLVELAPDRFELLLDELSRLDLPERYGWIRPRE
jgi:4-hydroxy-tetrahydrodipicolinate synthase